MNTGPDSFTMPRAKLRYMLELKQACGLPVVHAEGLVRELVEELDGNYRNDPDWQDIYEWAMGDDRKGAVYGAGLRLCACIEHAYRVMVGALPLNYHPDWLMVLPSAKLGSRQFEAWDRFGKRVV